MKLLFLTPQLPFPPHQGTSLRNFNILQGLAARHQVHLLSFGAPDELQASPLGELCRRIEIVPPPRRSTRQRAFETFFSPWPDMARRLDSPALAQKLAGMLRADEYDVIQVEGIEMARNWMPVVGNNRRPVSVFDDHNAEYVLQKTAYEADRRRVTRLHAALYSYVQWHKLARFERETCLGAQAVVAVSQQDAQALQALDTRIAPVVIPNGVDVRYYVPSEEACARPPAGPALVFTGKMDFRPNVDAATWFAAEILPALRRQVPLAHVAFVGQKPNARVRALARQPGVEVTGWVADTRPYIAEAAVYVVPLRMGGGTRLKVLEAMAMGKAIVSTTLGAAGIECVPGRDIIIADAAGDFARAVAALLGDPARRRELGANARRLAQDRYDWRKIVPKFETIYETARREPSRRPF